MKKQDKSKFWTRAMCWFLAVVMVGGGAATVIYYIVSAIVG